MGSGARSNAGERPPAHVIFTIATRHFVPYARVLVKTLRELGNEAPVIAYTDGPSVPEADESRTLDVRYLDRLRTRPERFFVRPDVAADLAAETGVYVVHLDADMFARRRVDLSAVLRGPVGAFVETDLETVPEAEWHETKCRDLVATMRRLGCRGTIRNLNGGLFSIHPDHTQDVLSHIARYRAAHDTTDEPPLAYAVACLNPDAPLLEEHRTLYDASMIDEDAVPLVLDGRPWSTREWLSGKPIVVDPALVHYSSQRGLLGPLLLERLESQSRRSRMARRLRRAVKSAWA